MADKGSWTSPSNLSNGNTVIRAAQIIVYGVKTLNAKAKTINPALHEMEIQQLTPTQIQLSIHIKTMLAWMVKHLISQDLTLLAQIIFCQNIITLSSATAKF